MQTPPDVIDLRSHFLRREEIMRHKSDSALGVLRDQLFHSIYHIIQVLHKNIERWEALRERDGDLAPAAPKIDDKARANDVFPFIIIQNVTRLHAFVSCKKGHGFAEALGAQRVGLENLVHGVVGIVGESESLLDLSSENSSRVQGIMNKPGMKDHTVSLGSWLPGHFSIASTVWIKL